MRGCIGVEIDSRAIRAVRLNGRASRPRVLETEWDPDDPGEAVRALGEGLGRARRVAVAIRLPLLFTKRVRLPPIPVAERRRVLQLEPQRYFPVRLEDLAIAVRDDDLVFAAREASVNEWIVALEALGSVDQVEAGPAALARALADAGIRDAVVALDDGERGTGLIEIVGSEVAGARRLYGGLGEVASALATAGAAPDRKFYLWPWDEGRAAALAVELGGMRPVPLPDLRSVPAPFLSAYGAALGVGRDLERALLPDEQRRRILSRRRKAVAAVTLAAAASAAFMLASLDAWRGRSAEHLAAEVKALQVRAAPVVTLQNQSTALERQARTVTGIAAARPDPLRVLLVLSERLPPGAYIRSLRLSGAEWQIEGFARRAAEVTQALGGAPELGDVRVLAASNRAQMGEQMNESFALAFRLVPRP